MAVHETYTCENCSFEFTDSAELFFYNHDLNIIEEYVPLVSSVGISDGFEIHGLIHESYCKNCEKYIKTF